MTHLHTEEKARVFTRKMIQFKELAPSGNGLMASVLCLIKKTGTVYSVETNEIVLHEPSKASFKPVSF